MSRSSVIVLLLTLAALPARAADPATYNGDVKPFLARYCAECHHPGDPKGGLDLTTYKGIHAGADRGPVLAPGKPDDSKIVLLVEGKAKPHMPPRKARQPRPEETTVLRSWVTAGAKEDGAGVIVTLPDVRPKTPVPTPVAALAYSPDGKVLAAAGRNAVLFFDPTGKPLGRLDGLHDRVTALAYRPDGKALAVASSQVGKVHEVRLFSTPAGIPTGPGRLANTHADLIYGLAFSPDGKLLASCGYDRLIHVHDVSGNEPRERFVLKDHSDSVYSVSFSPDGKLLASAGADRAVKVWDLATGKRLFTLGEPTDWVYACAWSPVMPAGEEPTYLLAAAGVDRSIRVWKVNAEEGKIVHSVFAHEGPILQLVYSADGKTLYSLSEDRRVKAWDTVRMVERRRGYPRHDDAVLSLAVRPDERQLAIGGYDGALALLDGPTGKVIARPLPRKPQLPIPKKVEPAAGSRGKALRITLTGTDLADATSLVGDAPGLEARLGPSEKAGRRQATLTFPKNTPPGVYKIRLEGPAGKSPELNFTVDLFDAVGEAEPNNAHTAGQEVKPSITVVGAIDRAGDVDFFRFPATAGQEVGVQITTRKIGSKLNPVLELLDPDGKVVAESEGGFLGHTCARAGVYALGVRDREYDVGKLPYRLHLGEVPVLTGIFPLGARQRAEATFVLRGVHLGDKRSVKMTIPAGAAPGSRLPVPVHTPWGPPLGDARIVVGEFPEVQDEGKGGTLPVPGTANGTLATDGGSQSWRFAAKKGQRLVVEVRARSLGSPLDSAIEILDARGQLVPRATLRCLAKTNVVFRDHNSTQPGIRIEAWSELAMDDYLLVGQELMRIHALPRNPDDDCRFYSIEGKRVAYLGTSPIFHPQGEPMYKVSVHPPGTTFPPNGLPVVTLSYRNDDGGPRFGKDSRLVFDVPADGEYQVRVADARGRGGPGFAYRLTVREPRPDFTVRLSPNAPSVSKGSALPLGGGGTRIDEFDGPIHVELHDLPTGFSAPRTAILPGEEDTQFALFATEEAKVAADAKPLRLVARAEIGGKEVVREVTAGKPRVIPPGDIVTTVDRQEVTIRPGGKTRMTVTVERRNGFKGRIPLDVTGLPHGVRVLNIGLNGILITPREITRTVVLYAEPWVKPMDHPIVVLSRREGKNTEHAARSVLLRVK
jgi:WD40 repeat protein